MLSIISLAASGTLVAAASLAYRQKTQKNKLVDLLKDPSPALTTSATSRVISSSKVTTGITALQKFKHETLNPLFEDMRTRHLKEISLNEEVLSEEQKLANQQLVFVSGIVISTTTCLLLYPPLVFVNILPILYVRIPFYKEGVDTLLKEKRVTTTVNDTILDMGILSYTFLYPPILTIAVLGLWFHTYAKKLVAQSKDGTRKNLTNLMGEQPQHVWVLRGAVELEVPFDSVQVGEIVVIKAGQMIPVDGMIHDGVASIDQHILTGESQPAEKGIGDPVFAATVVLSGKIYIRVEKTGQETSAAQVGQILTQTSDFTSSIQLRGQEIADRGALPTLLLGTLSLPIVGASKALAILFSGVGYNMKLLGPFSVMNFMQLTAYQGILIKDGRALEQVSKVDTVVFDKTGTLTLEQPHVGRLFTCHGYDEQQLLTVAAAAEDRQTHPIARAIQQEAHNRKLELPPINQAAYEVGYGIKVTLDQKQIRVGSHRFMGMEAIAIPDEIEAIGKAAHSEGSSLVYVAIGDQLAGAIELVPTVRPEAKRIINSLRQAGLSMYIISGDHERPTRALASQLGIDHYFAETLPENKAELIAQLQEEGKTVCFVGDGINDSIALKTANVSVSLRGASTIATDTAQIILMDQTLNQLEVLFELSAQFESNMQANLVTTVVPGVIIIGGAFMGLVGYGASIGIFSVGLVAGVTNAILPRFRRTRQSEISTR